MVSNIGVVAAHQQVLEIVVSEVIRSSLPRPILIAISHGVTIDQHSD